MKNSTKIILIATLLVLVVLNQFIVDKKSESKKVAESVDISTSEDKSSDVTIGGEFSLTDQNGNNFTQENLKGKYSLVYFGFTHCPMICPTALSAISLAMDQLGDKAVNFQPVFITTDPDRDDVARMKEFLANFNSSMIGLTGSKDELNKVTSAYKVYAEKIVKKGEKNYDINHSSIIYVMDRDGNYLTHFNHETLAEDIVKKLNEIK